MWILLQIEVFGADLGFLGVRFWGEVRILGNNWGLWGPFLGQIWVFWGKFGVVWGKFGSFGDAQPFHCEPNVILGQIPPFLCQSQSRCEGFTL